MSYIQFSYNKLMNINSSSNITCILPNNNKVIGTATMTADTIISIDIRDFNGLIFSYNSIGPLAPYSLNICTITQKTNILYKSYLIDLSSLILYIYEEDNIIYGMLIYNYNY